MAFIQIPLSNTLRMVRTDNQSGSIQNFDNRLLYQEDYVDYNDRPYYQKISSSDVILVQFSTDVDLLNITAKLFNLNGAEVGDETSNITQVLESTSFNVYNLSFSIAASGFYYLKIDFNNVEIYESEVFGIDNFIVKNMLKIEYNTSENDGIIYNNNETFVINIEGRIVEFEAGQNKEAYTNFNESLVNLKSYPTRDYILEFGPVPRYIYEKLNLALSHEVFKVNDINYQTEDDIDAELIKDNVFVTNLYVGSIKLRQSDYEDYISASDDVEPTINPILIDEFETVLFIKDSGELFFTKYTN